MQVLGIISEYNPFHQGHLYHLNKAKEASGLDYIVCAMSGNFVQRGEPAIFDKWARTQMALQHGVDLVLELPFLYATRSAYWFARGGIELLSGTGVVTHLSFGVETENPDGLQRMAGELAKETDSFKQSLKLALKEGVSYPRARAMALGKTPADYAQLNSPNNILGLAYLKVLQECQIPLSPVIIQREGSSYSENQLLPGMLPSATALRAELAKKPGELPPAVKDYLTKDTQAIICREYEQGRGPVLTESLNNQFMTLLRRSSRKELENIVDVTEGLENRIWRVARSAVHYREFLDQLKTKRFTYTRLQRFLLHLLFNYTKDKEQYLPGGPPYLRVLGFTAKGSKILREIKKTGHIPVITKSAHAAKFEDSRKFREFWKMDLLATDLYALLYPCLYLRKGDLDYYRKPVSIPRH